MTRGQRWLLWIMGLFGVVAGLNLLNQVVSYERSFGEAMLAAVLLGGGAVALYLVLGRRQ
jgi:hypothetical protein